jgi:cytochrome c biogenesis protein
MKLFKFQKLFQIISDLKIGIFLLALIAITSSFGSFIEQDESSSFYSENYAKSIYGFINANFILNFGLDHVYTTWWFLFLLFLFALSLISCTIRRQFPLFLTSKEFFFRKKKNSFLNLPFSIRIKNIYYLKEIILGKIQNFQFYIYQKKEVLYAYKGLIGRISPILVHASLIIILFGSTLGAFFNFKVQEFLPKGELFHLQNPLRIGGLTKVPQINTRINDFWVEYENNRIHQFYSNISILDNFGNELKSQTISVNNPLRYNQIDFYQSDWNLLGIRIQENLTNKSFKIYELPLFPLKNNIKTWVTWIKENETIKSIIFKEFQNVTNIYNEEGKLIGEKNIGDLISNSSNFKIIDILSSTGLLIKYDPSIIFIYLGFGLLMITTGLSYLPYTQIWIFANKNYCWIGSMTNRGKIQLEIDFENFIRYLEYQLKKTSFLKKLE